MEIIYHESKRKKETTQSSDADKKMPGRFYLNRTCEIFIRKIFFAQMNTVNTRNKKQSQNSLTGTEVCFYIRILLVL